MDVLYHSTLKDSSKLTRRLTREIRAIHSLAQECFDKVRLGHGQSPV